MTRELNIVECPRDAMQGIKPIISTENKVKLHSALLQVGFPILDFGSFVSAKAIPQMADTNDVLAQLNPSKGKLLAIVANLRGAAEAARMGKVDILGYPLSVSETFQQRNSNKSIVVSLEEIVMIVDLCAKHQKELVVYLSMAFGNPYNDPYSLEIVNQFAGVLVSLGIKTIAISDTIGLATPEEVGELYQALASQNSSITWGLHLHARPDNTKAKVRAALEAGCRRLDGAILGFGGCPLAKDDLVGNINTRAIIEVAQEMRLDHGLDLDKFTKAEKIAQEVFNPL